MKSRHDMENSCETKTSCMQMMVHRIKEYFPELIGIVIGAVGGFIYYKNIGCSTGSCPITSNPWSSIIWGSIMGYLIGGVFKKRNKK